jgi:beta-N-acetylhexosaminidase
MRPPFWPEYPAAGYFAELYQNNPQIAKEQIFDNFKKISQDLQKMSINVNCVPLLDIVSKETSEIIGNRSLGNNIDSIINLAKEICKSSLENNIYPVIKHIPGHGRAKSDSHLELPVVDASFAELANSDFLPFIALRDQKFAMTAHILFSAIDNKLCATISPKIIDIIRNFIGFKNILMTDDLSMKALTGSFEERTKASLKAGCDLILHCNGNQAEMLEIASSLPVISDNLLIKFSNP